VRLHAEPANPLKGIEREGQSSRAMRPNLIKEKAKARGGEKEGEKKREERGLR